MSIISAISKKWTIKFVRSHPQESAPLKKYKILSMSHRTLFFNGGESKKNWKIITAINVWNSKNAFVYVVKVQKCYLGKNTKKK